MNLKYKIYLDSIEDILFDEKNIYEYSPDIAIFLNISVKIPSLMKKLKKRNCMCCYILHEPYSGFRDLLKEKEYFPKALPRILVDCLICRKSDMVLLPSKRASDNYKRYCMKYNRQYMIFPLIFPDEPDKEGGKNQTRKYFSYIGSFSSSHNAKGYLAFMRYAYEKKLDIDFRIYTRSKLEEYMKDEFIRMMIDSGKLAVRQGSPMTTEEINQAYAQSICVWNVYHKSTQSGVLGNAFMLGTPVIASHVGVFEENIIDGYNGALIEKADDMEEIYEAYRGIAENIAWMEQNVRETYRKKYYYRSQMDTLSHLTESLFHEE